MVECTQRLGPVLAIAISQCSRDATPLWSTKTLSSIDGNALLNIPNVSVAHNIEWITNIYPIVSVFDFLFITPMYYLI